MIYFELPDSTTNRPINIRLCSLLKTHSDLFYPNVAVEAVFGCPPFCIWNGGCIHLPGGQMSLDQIEDLFTSYNSIGIPYRLTFTNRLLEHKHLYDTYGNAIASLGNVKGNSVIVSSDLMEKYISERYEQYSIIQSICRVYETQENLDKALEKNLVCLPVKLNRDWNYLGQMSNPGNAIILVNEYCPVSECDSCKEHYESFNRLSLYMEKDHMKCKYGSLRYEMDQAGTFPPHHIFPKDYGCFESMGIIHFKINGRASTMQQIATLYCRYFAKPEHFDTVFALLLA